MSESDDLFGCRRCGSVWATDIPEWHNPGCTLMGERQRHAGGTGTRSSITVKQEMALVQRLSRLKMIGYTNWHHGDCTGFDEASHFHAKKLGFIVEVHPPDDPKFRAFCEGDIIHPEKPYAVRNQDIVNAVSHMLAAPTTERPVPRSGTWMTIGFAEKAKVPVEMLYP